MYSFVNPFHNKIFILFSSLSDIFEGCLFNTINELLTLGFDESIL